MLQWVEDTGKVPYRAGRKSHALAKLWHSPGIKAWRTVLKAQGSPPCQEGGAHGAGQHTLQQAARARHPCGATCPGREGRAGHAATRAQQRLAGTARPNLLMLEWAGLSKDG